jgi:hypothetical protein
MFELLVGLGLCWTGNVMEDPERVKALFQQLEAQIKTMSCKFALQSERASENYGGVYYREPSRTRAVVTAGGITIDWIVEGTVRSSHHAHANQLMIQDDRQYPPPLGDVRELALFVYPDGEGRKRTIHELLDRYKPERIRNEANGDLSFRIAHAYATLSFRLSAEHNFYPKKVVRTDKESGDVSELEVAEFVEVKPGVFFPALINCRWTFPAAPANERSLKIIFSAITINDPLPGDAFLRNVPPGTRVGDEINQVVDVLDANGHRIRTNKRYVAQGPLGLPMKRLGTQTQAEAAGFPWLWVALGAALVLLLGGWVAWRRRALAS